MFYLSQAFIIVEYSVFLVSRYQKDKKNILIADNLSQISFILGYLFLRSANSVEHTIYGILRNIVGQKLLNSTRKTKIMYFIVMLILLCVMYGVTFSGCSTILFVISGIINLFAVIFLSEQGIRMGTALAALCNITAFLMLESYASILGEITCGMIGLMSFRKNYQMVKAIKNSGL